MVLQECREACGGQGLKTDNRVGALKAEYDVQLTFEGDNNVLMQQVCPDSKIQWILFGSLGYGIFLILMFVHFAMQAL